MDGGLVPTIKEARKVEDKPGNDTRPALTIYKVITDEGTEGEMARRSSDGPPPTGAAVTIEPSQYGPKAKLVSQNGRGRGRSPQETKAIQRQHSQEMALRWM